MRSRSRISRRAMLAAGVGVLALPGIPAIAASTRAIPGSTVFQREENGYHTFRIPAVVKAPNGDVLAFAQGRWKNNDDHGDRNLVMKRSTDGGQSWGELRVIWSDGPNKIGPMAPVVDQASGDIVLLAVRTDGDVDAKAVNTGAATWEQMPRPFVLRSTDNGQTWSDPVEITDDVKPRRWRHFTVGPGHAIQLTRGAHAGRIVASGNHGGIPADGSGDDGSEGKYHGVHLIYSDDGGHSWQLGAADETYDNVVNGDESQVVELTDGRLLQVMRDQGGEEPGERASVLSSDGGESYDGPLRPETMDTTRVGAGLLRVFATDDGDDRDLLLFSSAKGVPGGGEQDRLRMTIWRSLDEGQTWEEAHPVWDGRASYSDLTVLSDSRVGLLYEGGSETPYDEISFARQLIDELLP